MTKATNIMAIAPQQPSTSRRISPNTQPKYKTPARQSNRNFGSTLDKVNAKLDELKQNIQDLQDTVKKTAQVEGEQPPSNQTTEETPAQGMSDTPQDAEKAIRNEELGMRNDSEVADKDAKPADIFFGKAQPVNVMKNFAEDAPQKFSAKVQAPVVENFIAPTTPVEEPVNLDNSADLVDEQPPTNFPAATNPTYLFGANKETLLETKPVVQVEAPKADAVQNLMSLMPQAESSNAQSMLNMLGGKAWRPFDVQSAPIVQPTVQAQPAEAQPLQVIQPTIQAQPVTAQPLQVIQPSIQAQPVDVQPLQVIQPSIQAQPAEAQPLQVIQPSIQAQPVDVQPLQVIQPTIQAQPAEAQPLQVIQPSIQAQPAEAQPLQVIQPSIQAQPVDVQPLQVIQPSIQAQPVDVQPLQVIQPTIQAQPTDIQPTQIVQQSIQAQPVDVQPTQIVQPSIQAQPVDVQPAQVIQPTIQAQPVDVQPAQVIQPTIQAQPVDVQPAQVIQPTIQAQPVDVQPAPILQPSTQAQPVDVQPAQIVQPTIQAQPVDVQPAQIVQQSTQAQPAEAQPLQVIQPTIQTQPADVQPLQVIQPTIQTQPADVQPLQVIQPTVQAQPIIAPQRSDERPLQAFSELLGVNVQVEESPTAAPVTPPQAPPQQFGQQPQQRDAQQNFQNQFFQAATDMPQAQAAQPSATGGEVFAPNLTPTNDAPPPQPTNQAQAPDAPPPPQEDFDVPAQIVRQARLIRTAENTEMVIKLNPEHLGELTLRVSVSANGAVNASFHSDNAQVRTIIENALVQIRQELNNAGLKVENVDVYAGLSEEGLMSGQGGQAWQQGRQQRQGSGNRQIDLNALERDVDASGAPVNESTTDGVDYSV